jgi:hypothetical protein
MVESEASASKRGAVTHDPISDAKAAAARGDFEFAIAVLRPLADAGNRDAQYGLGFLAMTECELISGREACSLFLKAAEQGHAEAMYHLAKFPEFVSEPFKSPLSDEDAWSWLIRAAESGCLQAQYDAGASLATGDWGDTYSQRSRRGSDMVSTRSRGRPCRSPAQPGVHALAGRRLRTGHPGRKALAEVGGRWRIRLREGTAR